MDTFEIKDGVNADIKEDEIAAVPAEMDALDIKDGVTADIKEDEIATVPAEGVINLPEAAPCENEDDEFVESLIGLTYSDDEDTIAQEEALEPEVGAAEELRLLSEDMGLSLEELLAYSGKRRTRKPVLTTQSPEKFGQANTVKKDLPESDLSVLSQEASSTDLDPPRVVAMSSTQDSILTQSESSGQVILIHHRLSSDFEEPPETSELAEFYFKRYNGPTQDHVDSDVDDEEYLCPVMNVCEIQLGDQHQASVEAEAQVPSFDPAADEQEADELMWRPSENLSEEKLAEYLKAAWQVHQGQCHDQSETADHPIALKCLLEAYNDPEAALVLLQEKVQECTEQISEAKIQEAKKRKIPKECDETAMKGKRTETKLEFKKDAEREPEKKNVKSTNKRKRDKKEEMGPACRHPAGFAASGHRIRCWHHFHAALAPPL